MATETAQAPETPETPTTPSTSPSPPMSDLRTGFCAQFIADSISRHERDGTEGVLIRMMAEMGFELDVSPQGGEAAEDSSETLAILSALELVRFFI